MSNRSANGLVPSTADWDFDVPEVKLDTTSERKIARLSKTKQWQEVRAYVDGRIAAYQQYLPGANPAITGSEADWRVADGIIRELKALESVVETISDGAAR